MGVAGRSGVERHEICVGVMRGVYTCACICLCVCRSKHLRLESKSTPPPHTHSHTRLPPPCLPAFPDAVLPRNFDESAVGILASTVFFNNTEILQAILKETRSLESV